MKNSPHHLKHLIKKSIRNNSRLPTFAPSHDDILKRLKIYRETWGELQIQPRSQVKQVFHAYIHYLTNHPSSTSAKHSRRSSPGTVSTDNQTCTRAPTAEQKMADNMHGKLQEANLNLSKKLVKSSKVRWKKID